MTAFTSSIDDGNYQHTSHTHNFAPEVLFWQQVASELRLSASLRGCCQCSVLASMKRRVAHVQRWPQISLQRRKLRILPTLRPTVLVMLFNAELSSRGAILCHSGATCKTRRTARAALGLYGWLPTLTHAPARQYCFAKMCPLLVAIAVHSLCWHFSPANRLCSGVSEQATPANQICALFMWTEHPMEPMAWKEGNACDSKLKTETHLFPPAVMPHMNNDFGARKKLFCSSLEQIFLRLLKDNKKCTLIKHLPIKTLFGYFHHDLRV